MKKFALLSLFCMIIMISAFAQDSEFLVVLNKGDNTFGNNGDFKPFVLGEVITNDSEVIVAERGYLALIHEKSGLGIELDKAGKYKMQDLVNRLNQASSTVYAKYGKFLVSKLDPDGDGNANLSVTGAVERGGTDFINVYLPKITEVYGEDLVISWKQPDDMKDFIVTIKDKWDKTLIQKEITGSRYRLAFDDIKIKNNKMLIVNIRSSNNPDFRSKEYGISRISESERESMFEEYNNLLEFTSEDKVLNKLMMASFFEENELLADAISYYDQALALSPDSEGFEKLYNNFLYRNQLK